MRESPIRYERIGSAALVQIQRPERRNAIDGETAGLLRDSLESFERDDQARVLVLTGDDVSFCAGADLKAIDSLDPDNPDGPLGFTRLLASKPTIAAVSGWCLAGGVELALWCDMRIASQSATFGIFERRWGVPLIDGGTQRLPRVVGLGRALELILTGRPVDAPEALRIGLANEVVATGTQVTRALELAEQLAQFPQETMLTDRRAAIEGSTLSLEQGLELERELGHQVMGVAVEGAARFASGEGRHGRGIPNAD